MDDFDSDSHIGAAGLEDNHGKATISDDIQPDASNGTTPSQRKRGRQSSDILQFLSDDGEPQLKKSAVCKHWHQPVNCNKKSESAKLHLNSCAQFLKQINGEDVNELPAWYHSNKKRQLISSSSMAQSEYKDQSKSGSSTLHQTLKQSMLPSVRKQVRERFQQQTAMHFLQLEHHFSALKIFI